MGLRPYQKEAVEAVEKEWADGNKKTLLVAATGTGKTQMFVSVMEENVKKGHRELVLAHRGELLEQAALRIRAMTHIPCGIEKAKETTIGTDIPIVVGSVQSMIQDRRLSEFPPDYFNDIIVDECHHIMSDSYQKVLSHFPDANVLGVTATPNRADEKSLADYFDSKAYEYPLSKAIIDGYLSPIKVQTVPLKLDITSVHQQAGDFSTSELGTALDPYLDAIATEMKTYCKGRRTVVFTPLIRTARKFMEILKAHGFKAAEVNGGSEDRKEVLAAFSEGKIDVLLNSMLLTEGWDCPSVSCIINLRVTKSDSLYRQIIGRGTRLSPETGKEDLLILDFLWQTKTFDILHPASLIAKNDLQREHMNKLSKDGEVHDLFALAEEADEDIVSEREEALAIQLDLMRKMKKKCIDPIQFAFSIGSEALLSYEPVYRWENDPVTKKQLKMLLSVGIDTEAVKTKGQASHLITVLMNRRDVGLSTPKQIKLLEQRGFRHVGRWKKTDASEMIDKIAKNNWRVPYDIHPAVWQPSSLIRDDNNKNKGDLSWQMKTEK